MKANIGDRLPGKLLRLAQRLLESLSNTRNDSFFIQASIYFPPFRDPRPSLTSPTIPLRYPAHVSYGRYTTAGSVARQRRYVACSSRSWSRCNHSRALLTSHSPRNVPALRSTSTTCMHNAPSRCAHTEQHARFGRKRAQPCKVVPTCMLHKLVPQLRAEVRPHHSAGQGTSQGRSQSRYGAPLREARERGQAGGGEEGSV